MIVGLPQTSIPLSSHHNALRCHVNKIFSILLKTNLISKSINFNVIFINVIIWVMMDSQPLFIDHLKVVQFTYSISLMDMSSLQLFGYNMGY